MLGMKAQLHTYLTSVPERRHTAAQLLEALHYKMEVCRFNEVIGFFI
jgi:hypothetical protein